MPRPMKISDLPIHEFNDSEIDNCFYVKEPGYALYTVPMRRIFEHILELAKSDEGVVVSIEGDKITIKKADQ